MTQYIDLPEVGSVWKTSRDFITVWRSLHHMDFLRINGEDTTTTLPVDCLITVLEVGINPPKEKRDNPEKKMVKILTPNGIFYCSEYAWRHEFAEGLKKIT